MKLRPILAGAALLASLAVPSVAAAFAGYTTANVNLRAGPSTGYPAVTVIPYGAPIDIYGCLSDWSWCDTGWGGARGWIYGSYLQAMYQAQPVYLPTYAPRIGVPVISFEFVNYWDHHYHGRPWYRDRDRWYNYWRERQENRTERREVQQEETRQERRKERRQDARQEQKKQGGQGEECVTRPNGRVVCE